MHRTRLAALTAALTLLPTAAFAHPAFDGQAESGTPTDLTIVIPHGCGPEGGMPGDGEVALPTIGFDLELVDGVTVEPAAVDGWTASVGDGVVSWVADGGETTDVIEFPVAVTIAPDAGESFSLNAYQQCSEDTFTRWNGGDWPPVALSIVGAEDAHDDMEGMDHDAESEDMDHESEGMDDMDHEDDLTAEAGAQALAGEEAEPGTNVIVWALLAAVVVLLGGGILAVRRGKA